MPQLSNPALWDQVRTIDLAHVSRRLSRKLGWDQERCDKAIIDYRAFLYAAATFEGAVTPTPDIDEVWHAHILHTKAYAEACFAVFGGYLHHQPFGEDERADVDEQNRLRAFFEAEFGRPILNAIGDCRGDCNNDDPPNCKCSDECCGKDISAGAKFDPVFFGLETSCNGSFRQRV